MTSNTRVKDMRLEDIIDPHDPDTSMKRMLAGLAQIAHEHGQDSAVLAEAMRDWGEARAPVVTLSKLRKPDLVEKWFRAEAERLQCSSENPELYRMVEDIVADVWALAGRDFSTESQADRYIGEICREELDAPEARERLQRAEERCRAERSRANPASTQHELPPPAPGRF